jgi:DNA-binding NarL/FixJ family response regulator
VILSTRVLLADDHPIFLQGMKGLLEREQLDVIGMAMDGREAVKLAGKLKPDVVVLDLAMPFLNGLDAAREIGKVSPTTKKILLTNYPDDQYILDALRAGVNGYLVKTKAAEDLLQAIREVSRGALYLSSGVSHELLKAYLSNEESRVNPLSGREREVLQLIAEGKATKEIAVILGVSPKTVETHRTRLMGKLDIFDTAGLVRYAIRRGVIHL